MSASTSLVGLIASFALVFFLVMYPQKVGTPTSAEPVKIWKRFAALLVDYYVALAVTLPIAILPMLLAEANATGNFRWTFERDFLRSSGGPLVAPVVLLSFAALFAYFYLHPVVGRQTIGQFLLGFRVEGAPSAGSRPAFGKNVLLSFIGLCAWPVSLYLAANRVDKAFWWNLRTHTQVVRVIQSTT